MRMSDNKEIAAKLMADAGRSILRDRGPIHGPTEASFEMIGEMWAVYLRHVRRVRQSDVVLPEDVAQMLSMLKKSRSVYGDPHHSDNYADDIGYSALAGMLRLPDPNGGHNQTQENISHLKEALEDAANALVSGHGNSRDS